MLGPGLSPSFSLLSALFNRRRGCRCLDLQRPRFETETFELNLVRSIRPSKGFSIRNTKKKLPSCRRTIEFNFTKDLFGKMICTNVIRHQYFIDYEAITLSSANWQLRTQTRFHAASLANPNDHKPENNMDPKLNDVYAWRNLLYRFITRLRG